jgi:hypothetical protein
MSRKLESDTRKKIVNLEFCQISTFARKARPWLELEREMASWLGHGPQYCPPTGSEDWQLRYSQKPPQIPLDGSIEALRT